MPRPLPLFAAMLASLAGLLAQTRLERTVMAMGTELRLQVWAADRASAVHASAAAIDAVAAAERRLSTWREDSELQRLNGSAVGARVVLSPELAAELASAAQWSKATAGAFDPGIGGLIDAYDLRGRGRWPDAAELARARQGCGMAWLQRDGAAARRLHDGLRLDSGGFGKGAALDAAMTAACDGGADAVMFDFGGQIAVRGGGPQRVALADPDHREVAALELQMLRGSLAVSGNSERGRVVDGRHLPHLLDPRTGMPAPERGSFAVLAPTALAADCLSTGLYVAGWDAARAFVAAHPGFGVAWLQADAAGGIAVHTAGALDGRLRPLLARVRLCREATAISRGGDR